MYRVKVDVFQRLCAVSTLYWPCTERSCLLTAGRLRFCELTYEVSRHHDKELHRMKVLSLGGAKMCAVRTDLPSWAFSAGPSMYFVLTTQQ